LERIPLCLFCCVAVFVVQTQSRTPGHNPRFLFLWGPSSKLSRCVHYTVGTSQRFRWGALLSGTWVRDFQDRDFSFREMGAVFSWIG